MIMIIIYERMTEKKKKRFQEIGMSISSLVGKLEGTKASKWESRLTDTLKSIGAYTRVII